jgi:uncharacterized membrane protein/protein-disulfide isomerase
VPLALGGYLLSLSLTGGNAAGCGIDSGCGSVLASAWSRWHGIPVAALALPLYQIQFCLLAFPKLARAVDPTARWIPSPFFAVLLGGLLGGAAWFAFVQLHLIHAFCPWCLATHVSGIGVCAIAVWRSSAATNWLRSLPLSALSAVAAIAVLGLGQGVGEKRLPSTAASSMTNSPTPITRTAQASSSVSAVPARTWTLPISGVTLSIGEVPILGDPAAPQLVLHLFDYTCKHCRAMHPVLTEVLDHSSNLVAVVSLPVPLEMDCNPLLKRPIPEHIGACGLARIGLALWKAAPSKLREFDDWVFSQPTVPAATVAEAKAVELAGEAAFRQAQASPEIDRLIRTALGIYETQYRLTKLQSLPELLVGTNLYAGAVRDPAVLRDRIFGAATAGPR